MSVKETLQNIPVKTMHHATVDDGNMLNNAIIKQLEERDISIANAMDGFISKLDGAKCHLAAITKYEITDGIESGDVSKIYIQNTSDDINDNFIETKYLSENGDVDSISFKDMLPSYITDNSFFGFNSSGNYNKVETFLDKAINFNKNFDKSTFIFGTDNTSNNKKHLYVVGENNYANDNNANIFGILNSASNGGFAFGANNSAHTGAWTIGSANIAANGGFAFGANNSAGHAAWTIGSANSAARGTLAIGNNNNTSARGWAIGSANSAYDAGWTFGSGNSAQHLGICFGYDNSGESDGIVFGTNNQVIRNSLVFGNNNIAESRVIILGVDNKAKCNSYIVGECNSGDTAYILGENSIGHSGAWLVGKCNSGYKCAGEIPAYEDRIPTAVKGGYCIGEYNSISGGVCIGQMNINDINYDCPGTTIGTYNYNKNGYIYGSNNYVDNSIVLSPSFSGYDVQNESTNGSIIVGCSGNSATNNGMIIGIKNNSAANGGKAIGYSGSYAANMGQMIGCGSADYGGIAILAHYNNDIEYKNNNTSEVKHNAIAIGYIGNNVNTTNTVNNNILIGSINTENVENNNSAYKNTVFIGNGTPVSSSNTQNFNGDEGKIISMAVLDVEHQFNTSEEKTEYGTPRIIMKTGLKSYSAETSWQHATNGEIRQPCRPFISAQEYLLETDGGLTYPLLQTLMHLSALFGTILENHWAEMQFDGWAQHWNGKVCYPELTDIFTKASENQYNNDKLYNGT